MALATYWLHLRVFKARHKYKHIWLDNKAMALATYWLHLRVHKARHKYKHPWLDNKTLCYLMNGGTGRCGHTGLVGWRLCGRLIY